jgi:hypothetical protein
MLSLNKVQDADWRYCRWNFVKLLYGFLLLQQFVFIAEFKVSPILTFACTKLKELYSFYQTFIFLYWIP